ncbi:hypothetical protein HPB50_022069 [Hyalomma asiaticum]|uniref:Uncharacterized protein n=1 Tax=Hyalomma asiaticum TaxID=266040 RepID=A0ACB7TM75_HYAAI|nr:hypothetical protein HPB50_022069 [Hyalomma asiaticum]
MQLPHRLVTTDRTSVPVCVTAVTFRPLSKRRQSGAIATTDDEDALIVAAAVRNPFLHAPAIREDLDLDVSDTTVRCRLRTAGLSSHVAAQKPLLTAANKDARRRFAELHESWTAEEWGQVIFSDESTFSTRQDQRLRVSRLPGTR